MRLLSLDRHGGLVWKEFSQDVPPYAILSHTWGTDEVSFADLVDGQAQRKAGYRKIVFCGEQACRDDLRYFWVDTCCIDKRNNTELTKAINSMFRWYRGAVKCYVHLSDVSSSTAGLNAENHQSAWEADFRKSRWFTRGWTLQELLAPACVEFFAGQQQRLGSKDSLCALIHEITGIPMVALRGQPLNTFSTEARLAWAAGRQTTDSEDEAYCLLGIFNVNLPLIYGEGKDNALKRLHKKLGRPPTVAAQSHVTASSDAGLGRKACLRSLVFSHFDARQHDIADAHPGTCDWFFTSDEFCQWRDRAELSTNNGVLWIKGKPGAGKSTLMKHVLKHCRNRFLGQLVLAHFFNVRGERLEKTCLGMLRSIVYQLVLKDSAVCSRFEQRYREKEMVHEEGMLRWRTSELRDFVVCELGHLVTKPIILLIDALDECSEADIRTVVDILEDLSTRATRAGSTVQICLSSRHYPTINMNKMLESTLENNTGHEEDIVIYVREKLESKDEKLWEGIVQKSNGLFLWAILVVTILNKALFAGRIEEIEETLDSLPGDLEAVFDKLLAKAEVNKPETVLMLQLVLFSVRPLTPEELFFGAIAQTAPQLSGPWDRARITDQVIERRITDSSKGLIEVKNRGGRLEAQFVHTSVKDFLLRNRRLCRLDPNLGQDPHRATYKRLWSYCWKYVEQFGMTKTIAHDQNHAKHYYPFLEYALCTVFHFANEALPAKDPERARGVKSRWLSVFRGRPQPVNTDEDILLWLGESRKWFMWWKQAMLNSTPPNYGMQVTADAELVHILVHNGWQKLLELILAKGADVNAQGGYHGSALQAAAYGGTQDLVQLLLDAGADVNAQGGQYGNALQAASWQGTQEMVQVLLNAGANVNAQGGSFGSALQAASWRGTQEIVQQLLDAGADANAQGGQYGTALQAAAYGRSKEMLVKVLLHAGADVNAQGGQYGNALQAAAMSGTQEMVQVLLNAGADVNAQGGYHGSALQAASWQGTQEIVQVLLNAGADINAQGGSFGSALQAAAFEGRQEIVQQLLDAGADTSAQGGRGGTALYAAADRGWQEVVRLLLDGGADVNAQGGYHGSALQAAAFEERQEIVQQLLDAGADAHMRGCYSTAL